MIPIFLLLGTTKICYAQSQQEDTKIRELKNPDIEDYEQLVYDATQYLLNNPINEKSADFVSACKIVNFWIRQDTGYGLPLGGNFYYKLTNTNHQQFYYAVSMVHYLLDQKRNHNRIIKCVPQIGQCYKNQEDVQEVRVKAAEIFLNYAKKRRNRIKLTVRSRKYLKHYRKGTLAQKFRDELDEPPIKKEINSPFIIYLTSN
ncbi:hypothetical protein [Aureibaculum marinum]|uniref:hypothetical protein n=1 Tax=Aureibaculum marinum TaxID=2487930 RepID=UPI000F4FDD20|nr:hypothetical protein [Aureibaculum marinum]